VKIPFERTIAAAYRFVASNFVSVLGIGWFPFLVLVLIGAALLRSVMPRLELVLQIGQEKWSPDQAGQILAPIVGAGFVFAVTVILAAAMVIVGMMRKALGQHPAPIYFFFSFGSQVWRMIGAYVLLLLLLWAVTIGVAIGIGIVSAVLSKALPAAQVPVTVLLPCVAVLWGIYAIVRLQFFLPAVVVAENHIGLRRSWQLGRGNFWRIIGIVIVIILPIGIVHSILTNILLQTPMTVNPATMMTPEQVRAYFAATMNAAGRVWPLLVLIEMLYMVIVTGLAAGAIANAYNYVAGTGDTVATPTGSTKASA
jgi:hypothetical protein